MIVQLLADALLVAMLIAVVQIAYNTILYGQTKSVKTISMFGAVVLVSLVALIAGLIGIAKLTAVPVLGGLIGSLNLIGALFWSYIQPVRYGVLAWFLAIPALAFVVLTVQAGVRYRRKKLQFEENARKKEAEQRKTQASEQPVADEAEAEPEEAPVLPALDLSVEPDDEPDDKPAVTRPVFDLSAPAQDEFNLDVQGAQETAIDVTTQATIRALKQQSIAQGLLVDTSQSGHYQFVYGDGKSYKQAEALFEKNHLDTSELLARPAYVVVTKSQVTSKSLTTLLTEVTA